MLPLAVVAALVVVWLVHGSSGVPATSLVLLAFGRLASRTGGVGAQSSRLAARLAFASAAVLPAGVAWWWLAGPLVWSTWTARATWNAETALSAVVVGGLASVAISVCVGALIERRGARASVIRVVATMLSIGLVLMTAAAGLRRSRPSFDGYVASLPVVALLPPLHPADGGTSTAYAHAETPKFDAFSIEVAGLTFRHLCDRGAVACLSTLGRTEAVPPIAALGQGADRAPVTIRRDSLRDIWIVGDGWSGSAYFGGDLVLRPLRARDVADAVRVPATWIGLGGFGILVVALEVHRRRRALRMAARVSAGHQAVSVGGWLTFADGRPPERVARDGMEGPVVCLDEVRASSAPYRGAHVDLAVIVPGTKAKLVAKAHGAARLAEADALMAAALAIAPLLVAAACGLVG